MCYASAMRRPMFKPSEVAEALTACYGVASHAAKMLGCTAATVRSYAIKYPVVREALVESGNHIVDIAEGELIQALLDGAPWAIRFVLKSKGASRGWVAPKQIDAVVEVRATTFDGMTQEELLQIVEATEPDLRLIEGG